jgi:pimeloyl-ACP methyl ester carboxylesterase
MTTAETVQIAYDDIGSGDPAVVLLHGLFEDRSYFAAQMRHLAQRRRVLNLDLRGHGASDVPTDGYSLDVMAEDVARVCDETGVRRAVFCGHSMAVALKVAVRRPDLAAAVVLLDGAVLHLPPALAGMRQLARQLEGESWREAAVGFFTRAAGRAAERVRTDIERAPTGYAAPILRDIAASSTGVHAHELASLQCPLLYVHGQMPIDLEQLRQLQPDVIVEEIPNAGHYLMLTAPDRVNAVLDRFLEVIK